MLRREKVFGLTMVSVWLMLGAAGGMCVALPFVLRLLLGSIDTAYMKRFWPMLVCLYAAVLAAMAMCVLMLELLLAARRGRAGYLRDVSLLLRGCAAGGAVQCVALLGAACIMRSGAALLFGVAAAMAGFLSIALRAVIGVLRGGDETARSDAAGLIPSNKNRWHRK